MVDEVESQKPIEYISRNPRRRRQIYMQIVAGILIFFSGIIVGSGGTVLWVKDRVAWIRPPHEKSIVPKIVETFKSEYNLTEEQARQVREIFQEGMQLRKSIYEEMSQKLEEHEKTLNAMMKKILSAQQYKQWVSDFNTRRNRFDRFERRGPRPEGPGPEKRGRRFGPGKPGQKRVGEGRPDPNRPAPGKPGEKDPDLKKPELGEPNSTP